MLVNIFYKVLNKCRAHFRKRGFPARNPIAEDYSVFVRSAVESNHSFEALT